MKVNEHINTDNNIFKNSTIDKNNNSNVINFKRIINNKNAELNSDRNSQFKKLFLPSLKNILHSENLFNSNSLKISTSLNKSNKRYELNNLKINPIEKINAYDNDKKKLLLKSVKNDENNNNMKDENIVENKEKQKIENNNDQENNIKNRNEKIKRRSIFELAVKNYNLINNVNDYILNYNQIKNDKKLVNDDNNNKKGKDNKTINEKNDNLNQNNIDNKNQKNYLLEYEGDNNKQDSKNIIVNNNDSEIFESEASGDEDKKTINNKEKDQNKTLGNLSFSSIDNKDPLDDIKYLKKLRKKQDMINYKKIEHLLEDD